VHCNAFGLPDLLFEMHPCGLRLLPQENGTVRICPDCGRQHDALQQAPSCWSKEG
jgi:predicted RNA-binding Zn-ribbon protein involved in translation (DUF1610 family)